MTPINSTDKWIVPAHQWRHVFALSLARVREREGLRRRGLPRRRRLLQGAVGDRVRVAGGHGGGLGDHVLEVGARQVGGRGRRDRDLRLGAAVAARGRQRSTLCYIADLEGTR